MSKWKFQWFKPRTVASTKCRLCHEPKGRCWSVMARECRCASYLVETSSCLCCWNIKLLKLLSVTLTNVCGTNSHNWWAEGLPGVGVVKIFCDSDSSGWKSFRLLDSDSTALDLTRRNLRLRRCSLIYNIAVNLLLSLTFCLVNVCWLLTHKITHLVITNALRAQGFKISDAETSQGASTWLEMCSLCSSMLIDKVVGGRGGSTWETHKKRCSFIQNSKVEFFHVRIYLQQIHKENYPQTKRPIIHKKCYVTNATKKTVCCHTCCNEGGVSSWPGLTTIIVSPKWMHPSVDTLRST